MKKSIMIMAVVFLAMVSLAFAEVQIVESTSTSFNEGLVGAQLYLNDSNVWVQQMKLYNGTAFPGTSHPCYRLAGSMTLETTVASSNSRVRYPTVPYVFPAETSEKPVAYYIFGDAEVLVAVKRLSETGLRAYYGESVQKIETAIGTVDAALIYGVSSGMVTYFPVKKDGGQSVFNANRLKAILAADSFSF